MTVRRAATVVAAAVVGLAGCGGEDGGDGGAAGVERLVPRVVAEHPHDTTSFTQGLLLHDGVLYESAGRYGSSSLREVDPDTGAVRRQVAVAAPYFAEGLALVDGELLQLTWKERTALVYDVDTLQQVGTYSYDGEGWGLCAAGDVLYMSDGSSTLTRRDADDFSVLGTVTVTLGGAAVDELNELECIGDRVLANVWHTDTIVEIDAATGDVTAEIDASGLLDDDERVALGSDEAVLNGIADAGGGRLFLTGKLWPTMFEVELVEG